MADPLSVFVVVTRHQTATFKVKGRKSLASDRLGTAYAAATIDELLELSDDELGQWLRGQLIEARGHVREAKS